MDIKSKFERYIKLRDELWLLLDDFVKERKIRLETDEFSDFIVESHRKNVLLLFKDKKTFDDSDTCTCVEMDLIEEFAKNRKQHGKKDSL